MKQAPRRDLIGIQHLVDPPLNIVFAIILWPAYRRYLARETAQRAA